MCETLKSPEPSFICHGITCIVTVLLVGIDSDASTHVLLTRQLSSVLICELLSIFNSW